MRLAGNAGVARTAVGELAHNAHLNQGQAFSLFGFCSAIGYIIGPLLGGFLANPAERFWWIKPAGVFVKYPYLVPCLVSGCYNIIVFAISWFLLEETNQKPLLSGLRPKPSTVSDDENQEATAEQEPLLERNPTRIHAKRTTIYCVSGIA